MPTIRPHRTLSSANQYRGSADEFAAHSLNDRSPARRVLRRSINARPRVLHVGCGPALATRLHRMFCRPEWEEIRVDIDSGARPDIAVSIVDMHQWVDDESCQAVWASHVIEHLDTHEVPRALGEIRRVLAPQGFALIRCPDLETIAQFVTEGRLNDVIYTSPAGPITPLDMIFGHNASIARGQSAMRHGTGFTESSLAQALLRAGFAEVRTTRSVQQYEVWAVAFRPEADLASILEQLARAGTDMRR